MERDTLTAFIHGRPEVVEGHIRDLSDAVNVADGFISAHLDAVEQIRVHAEQNGTDDIALVLLGTHQLNLYTSVLELALRGRFDVAWYLTRALLDARSLAYALAKDPAFAGRFMQDKLKGSEARRFNVEDLDENGYSDIVGGLADRWKRNADASNSLSHLSVSHLGMLISSDGATITPHYGGHSNNRSCLLLFASAHEEELWFLTNLEHLRRSALSEVWSEDFLEAKVRYGAWRKKYDHYWTGETSSNSALIGQPK